MGGVEGSRGYVYQGIVAVLEALKCSDWDQIYIEPYTEEDKVDIALKRKGVITDAIQVKSTNGSFSAGSLKSWINDIINDFSCPSYKLILVGNCGQSATSFRNALEKVQATSGNLSAKDWGALDSFNTSLLENCRVKIDILPYEPGNLMGLIRDALNSWVFGWGSQLNPQQLALLSEKLLTCQLIKSTRGQYTDRTLFEEEIQSDISQFLKESQIAREWIGIISYSKGTKLVQEKASSLLDLRDKFAIQAPKRGVNWEDIKLQVVSWLHETTNPEKAYQISIEAPCSIAFAAGRYYNAKESVDICPMQYGSLWNRDNSDKTSYSQWKVNIIERESDTSDVALSLGVRHCIVNDVMQYLEKSQTPVKRIISCTLESGGATSEAIQNGTHAARLAEAVFDILSKRSIEEKQATLHIFASAPNGFMFRLGQNSQGFGKCLLYEYDYIMADTGTYSPSMNFNGKDDY